MVKTIPCDDLSKSKNVSTYKNLITGKSHEHCKARKTYKSAKKQEYKKGNLGISVLNFERYQGWFFVKIENIVPQGYG